MLRLLSIYLAPDGEANAFHQGTWSVFIRTAGCTVGCTYCDTKYSWSAKRGKEFNVRDIIKMVGQVGLGADKVTITGGEPLQQSSADLEALISLLRAQGYKITIETGGTEPVAWLKNHSDQVALVLDWKVPGRALKANLEENFLALAERHVIKYVVCSDSDFDLAVGHMKTIRDRTNARFVLSPAFPVKGFAVSTPSPGYWIDRMKAADLPRLGCGLNLQMHKFLYQDDQRQEEANGYDWSSVHGDAKEPA